MKPQLCVVGRCDHADQDDWLHVAPRREQPITAHLAQMRQVAA